MIRLAQPDDVEAMADLHKRRGRDRRLWALETNARARRFPSSAGWREDGLAEIDSSAGVPLGEVRYVVSLAGADAGDEHVLQ